MKIKRKVVLHGQSTLTISIPSSWIKKYNIKKGDELNIEEQDSSLRITTDKEIHLDSISINVDNLKRVGISTVTSAYRAGFSEIHLTYEDPAYIESVQNLISREMTGFEILRQSKNSCTIKDITGHSKDEFDTALRRTWLLTLDLSEESLRAIIKTDLEALKNIHMMDYGINKFSNYCLRLLNKKGYVDFRKTSAYYHLIKNIEQIADQYKDLCSSYLNNKEKTKKQVLDIFRQINNHLREFYELVYKYDPQEMENLFSKTKMTHAKILKLKGSMAASLAHTCGSLRNLLTMLIEINLEQG